MVDSCSQGLDRLCAVSSGVLLGIEPRLKDFHQLLLSPPKVGSCVAPRRAVRGPDFTVGLVSELEAPSQGSAEQLRAVLGLTGD